VQVTGDAAAGTVTLSVSLPGVEQGQFTLSMEYIAAIRLATGLVEMAHKIRHAREELVEKAKRKSQLN
jgi:hypothetical protein